MLPTMTSKHHHDPPQALSKALEDLLSHGLGRVLVSNLMFFQPVYIRVRAVSWTYQIKTQVSEVERGAVPINTTISNHTH